jgi:hypothetical protein
MELPRKLSQASLNALEEAKQRELNKSLPEINLNSDPFVGASPNPKIASDKAFAQTFAPPSIKNGQPSSAFPSHFPRQNLASRQQVTANQFFNRAAKPAVEKTEAEARVAEVKALALPLPKGITTGDSTYSPGSVRSLEKKLW